MRSTPKTTGLRYWMLRVLDECDNASAGFSADPVHDLRVALRRCRSMADGTMAMDPDPEWKAMKKAGKQLFQSLGALRDVQVMMDWIEKLEVENKNVARTLLSATRAAAQVSPQPNADAVPQGGERDPAAQALLHILKSRETEQKHQARAALDEFDRKQWRQWSKSLPQRAARIRSGSTLFKHLALERWTMARELHTRAMHNRSQIALHTLRIGIKRFRYIVENFLPEEHSAWSGDLKHMQDLLGEVHDLDVFWATALSCRVFPDEASRKAWHARIVEERTKRVDDYREKTTGPDSLWSKWRAGLPQGKQIQDIATRRMKLWARTLDPDAAHCERVARLSLELFDGLGARGLLMAKSPMAPENSQSELADARASLYAASLLHDVGKSSGQKGHHKESMHLIQKHSTPLGWKTENLTRAAIIARFHCGALPTRTHKALRNLPSDEQRTIIRLAAILRLANAMDCAHDGHVRRVKIESPASESLTRLLRVNGHRQKRAGLRKGEALIIAAEGYADGTPTAQAVAAERYLLETVLRRPVLVRPLKVAPATGRAA